MLSSSISTFTPTNIILASDSPVPLIPSVLVQPSLPLVTTVTTQPVVAFPLHPSLDLNKSSELHKKVTSYFYYKTLDKWLRKEKDMLGILNYLKVTDRGVDVLDNMNEYKETNIDKDTQDTINKKIDYIEKNILDKTDIYMILKEYVKETHTNWFDLEKNSYFIKELIRKFLKRKLQTMIERKSRK